MPIASQANSHAIGSIGVRILCSDVTILFVIRMRSPIPAFRHPPNLRLPESSLTLVVQRKLYHICTLLPRKRNFHAMCSLFRYSESCITGYMALKFLTFRNPIAPFSWTLLFYHIGINDSIVKLAEFFIYVGVNL